MRNVDFQFLVLIFVVYIGNQWVRVFCGQVV